MSKFDRSVMSRDDAGADRAVAIDAALRAYIIRAYHFMAAAAALSGIVAWFTFWAAVPTYDPGTFVDLTSFYPAIFGLVVVLFVATLGLVFLIRRNIRSLKFPTAFALFMVYAGLVGAMVALVFLAYTLTSVSLVFFISAASYLVLGFWAYTTKRGLSEMGSFMLMCLIGMILALIVILIRPTYPLLIFVSIIGVIVFAGLTAYKTHRIKEMYDEHDDATVANLKALMGAVAVWSSKYAFQQKVTSDDRIKSIANDVAALRKQVAELQSSVSKPKDQNPSRPDSTP
jgi:FtsH-binding integral membrane protein